MSIAAPLWILASLALFYIQFIVVSFNAGLIVGGLSIAAFLRFTRGIMRWFNCSATVGPRAVAHELAAALFAMRRADSYDSWLAAATLADRFSESSHWRLDRNSDDFNAQLIEDTRRRLHEARARKDLRTLVFTLRTVMHRQYGGLDQPDLYRRAYTGTKVVIDEYFAELCSCLEYVAAASDVESRDGTRHLKPTEKLEFFEQCRLQVMRICRIGIVGQKYNRTLQVGRTALALSGGGALAMSHMGVVKCLIESGLLPRVIAGTSGGSIIAGMVRLAQRSPDSPLSH